MRNALYESVRWPNSPPTVMAATAGPLLTEEPERNLTSFEHQPLKTPPSEDPSLRAPVTPHLTLHQFRKFQQSPALSTSSTDLDYKRVRRKQSFAGLIRVPSAPSTTPLVSTSSFTPSHLASPRSLLPSLLPPLPLSPPPRPSTTSPSLSSTIETLQSTPTHSPILHGVTAWEQWSGDERGQRREPIRTKRKFPLFKQAKRLPHLSAQGEAGSEGIWQVYAAVVDLGDVAGGDFTGGSKDLQEAGAQLTSSESDGRRTNVPQDRARVPSAKKGRSVRFEGISSSSEAEESSGSKPLPSERDKLLTSTSSLSLSNFPFPAPPGQNWTGTFGKLSSTQRGRYRTGNSDSRTSRRADSTNQSGYLTLPRRIF